MRATSGLVVAACVSACAHAPVVTSRDVTPEEWRAARAELSSLRATAPSKPYVVEVRVTMREPRSGRTFDGRGAVAVDPRRAMRMILVGPGGATALDAWVTGAAWRLAIPALDKVRRGGSEAEPGLPIGFFRWWFLGPLDGQVLAARGDGARFTFVLRDDAATVELREAPRRGLVASRRERSGAREQLEWIGSSLAPHPGDRALYVQKDSGLRVEVTIDAVGAEPPEPEAFVDPDRGGS